MVAQPICLNESRLRKEKSEKNGWCICDSCNVPHQTGIFGKNIFFGFFQRTLCILQTQACEERVGWFVATTPLFATYLQLCVMCGGHIEGPVRCVRLCVCVCVNGVMLLRWWRDDRDDT